MKIACIGWGSLVWKPDNLLIHREWFMDGPFLPLEFTRQSIDGRLTLAITAKLKPLRTLWALMATNDLEEARASLCNRELKSTKNMDKYISLITVDSVYSGQLDLIVQDWVQKLKLDAAIWTNLPPRFMETDNRIPTYNEAIIYLKELDINKRKVAEEYIRRAPRQIDTFYRRGFEKELGWDFKN